MTDPSHTRSRGTGDEAGFTLIELLMSVAILMVVSGLMMRGTLDMSRLNAQQSNRSDMHAAIRNATALLQQEVGQAGRVAFPGPATMSGTTAGNQWVTLTPAVSSIFPGQRLVVGVGTSQEVVTVTAVNTGTFRAVFASAHNAGAPVRPAGGFAAGIIPTTGINGRPGSSASVLKIVGDINSDGNIVYVEYTCDWAAGRMYRNMMPHTAGSKPALTVQMVLLDNLLANPPDPNGIVPPCFSYEQRTVGTRTYVVNVAIMTTVRTHDRDPITGEFQRVTKALLNVAPRNVFHVWQIASLGYENRIQPLPATVENLLN